MMQIEEIKVKFKESIDEVTETLKLKWEKIINRNLKLTLEESKLLREETKEHT